MKRQANVANNYNLPIGTNEISNSNAQFDEAIEIDESFEDDGLIHFSETTITS